MFEGGTSLEEDIHIYIFRSQYSASLTKSLGAE